MKTCFGKIISIILVLSLLLGSTLSLSSCSYAIGFIGDVIDKLGTSGDDTSEDLKAQRMALLSAVTITASFEVRSTNGYYPGFTETRTKGGSGVIYKLDKETGDAYIITNYHVVFHPDAVDNKFSENIFVYLYGLESPSYAISAEYLGGAFEYDIAVLKVSGCDLLKETPVRAAEISDSELVRVLDPVIAIGNASADGFSVTKGSVSVISEYLTMTSADNIKDITVRVMRIDTPINDGNSGGGIFNAEGKLVGIVNAKKIGEKIDNIAYAIPINLAKAVADNIIDHSAYGNGMMCNYLLGINFNEAERMLGLDENGEVFYVARVAITKVESTSPFYGELKTGDTIVRITVDNLSKEVTAKYYVSETMLTARPGSTVTLIIDRVGERKTITTTVTESMGSWQ